MIWQTSSFESQLAKDFCIYDFVFMIFVFESQLANDFCIYDFVVVKGNVYKRKGRPPRKQRVEDVIRDVIEDVTRDVNAEGLDEK